MNDQTTSQPKVAIVGYGMGNIASLFNAFRAIGANVAIASTPAQLDDSSHIVLPGVGAFPQGMRRLHSLGFVSALQSKVREGHMLLGVCLGMQLLGSIGEEHEHCAGLGFIPGRVVRLTPDGLRVPHVGWNDTYSQQDKSLIGSKGQSSCFYYVHSYHFVPEDPNHASLSCNYGSNFVAGVRSGRVLGVQFHPEKSHAAGLQLLRSFMELDS